VPGLSSTSLAAVPFAGQVAVAKAVLEDGLPAVAPAERARRAGVGLAISLAASGLVSWLLLRATTAAVRDEEMLFRGPELATTRRWRPARRLLPTPAQGMAAAAFGLAGLWYAQGLAPADLARALPIQQGAATLLPLALLAWWQRVDRAATFRLRWPTGAAARGSVCLAAAAVCGGCLFVVGAAAFLAVRGTHLSPEARQLSERLVELFSTVPWWASWLLIAVLPAVGEELLFRGWMLAAFAGQRPAAGRAAAAVVGQAAGFAALHLLPERMPQTFVLGLLLGWLTLRSGSILPAILAHLVHNSVPLAVYALAVGGPSQPDATLAGLPGAIIAGAVGCLAAALAVIWTVTRGAAVAASE
jgi:sodium transport system permease protein